MSANPEPLRFKMPERPEPLFAGEEESIRAQEKRDSEINLMSKWEKISNRVSENEGLKSPIQTNQKEKSKWETIGEQYNKQKLKQKLKNDQPVAYEELPWGKTIKQAMSNLPSDIIPFYQEYITGIYEALSSPIVTAKGLKSLAVGTLKTGMLRQFSAGLGMPLSEEKIKKDEDINKLLFFEREMYNNFGTEANLKKFIAKNPMEALFTLGELLIPAGKLTKIAGATKIGKGMEKAGAILDPLATTKEVVKKPFSLAMNLPGFKKMPESLFRRAINFKKEIPFKKQDKLLNLALKNETALNMKGYLKLSDQIDELSDSITGAIAKVDQTTTMPVVNILKDIKTLERSLMGISSEDVSKAFRDVKRTIIRNQKKLKRKNLTPEEVQAMKVRFNKELSKDYQDAINQTRLAPLRTDAKKAINKNLREFLEEIVPETRLIEFPKLSNKIIQKTFPGAKKLSIKQINRLEGDLIELRHAMSKSVNEIRAGSLFDFQLTAKTATGASAAGALSYLATGEANFKFAAVGGLVGLTFGILDSNPLIKSKVAIYLNNLKSLGINVNTTGSLIRMGLYEAGDYAKEFDLEDAD